MMTTIEKKLMFDVLFSTNEWAGNAKLPPVANRKVILLFALVLEKELKAGSDLFELFPKGLTQELEAFIKDCLDKAGLQVFYEKLKAIK